MVLSLFRMNTHSIWELIDRFIIYEFHEQKCNKIESQGISFYSTHYWVINDREEFIKAQVLPNYLL